MRQLPPVALQQTLNCYLEIIVSSQVTQFSPMIFKPFLDTFTLSSEVYQVHFLLILLKNFGLELFTTAEEQFLVNQMTKLSAHPSLVIAYRLLILDFIKALMPIVKRSDYMEPEKFQIMPFDGPDTQEKKLLLLNETSISDGLLLSHLKPLQTLSLSFGNYRATNSLYRILHSIYEKRHSMDKHIETTLISLILASPAQHVRHSLGFLSKNLDLAPSICGTFLRKLLHMKDIIKDEGDLKEYFLACEWILSKENLINDSDALSTLLKFLYEKCQEFKKLAYCLLFCAGRPFAISLLLNPTKRFF